MSALHTALSVGARLRVLPRPGGLPRLPEAMLVIVLASPFYGLVMGSFDPSGERILYAVFAAAKMPMLLLVTALVCLPGYVVLSTVLGLRDDLAEALRAIVSSQAAFAAALASLAPFTLFVYLCGPSHRWAIVFNGLMFLCATAAAQHVLWRRYWRLIERSPRHAVMLVYWMGAYVFVGIETGWMLRPFVGTPGIQPTFFRAEPFSNAYVVVWNLLIGAGR